MAYFEVPMRRYRFREHHVDDNYTLHCPFSIVGMSPDTLVPVRQLGGTRDNEVFLCSVGDLREDKLRDRRHRMVSHARLLTTYGPGLGTGTPVWIASVSTTSPNHPGDHVWVVSLTHRSSAMVRVVDLSCRPERETRRENGLILTSVGPVFAKGTSRKSRDIFWQAVIEQRVDGTDARAMILKKSFVERHYLHVKRERCGELLNLRERLRWRSKRAAVMARGGRLPSVSSLTTALTPRSQWLSTVINPVEKTYS